MPVRLLLDENVSERLVSTLSAHYPVSTHVRLLGLGGAPDDVLWERAKREDCVLVTKDEDFVSLSVLRGAPPKVIWLDVGNAGTKAITNLPIDTREAIEYFVTHPDAGFLALRFGTQAG